MSLGGPPQARPIRVALLAGVCVRYDAISYSLRLKLDLLRSLRDSGLDVEVNVFVQGTDITDRDISVRSLRELILDNRFNQSEVLIYEFGIDYELFDSLFLLKDGQRGVGIYHNITPPDLVENPWTLPAVERGLRLRQNLAQLDHVACDSEFNRQDLLSCGLPESQLSVLPLPPRISLPRLERPRWSVDPVDILFVGRLVRAKGIHDLLAAAALLRSKGKRRFRVTLAGSPQFSERETLEFIRSSASERTDVRMIADPDDDALAQLYRSSSVLAMPSYHEGYCLPVLEALDAGCQIVAYDAGNLPSIVGSLGQVVETADVAGFARALRRAIEAVHASQTNPEFARIPTTDGDRPRGEWLDAAMSYVAQHSREDYERTFLAVLRDIGVDLSFGGRDPG